MLQFVYDESGAPYALRYSANGGSSWRTFYYILNLQGDVVKLVYENGIACASYTYNAWGQVISATTLTASPTANLANLNPLRYRGYYYDTETGFYYLQSRYYDPAICRFLNSDCYASTGQGFIGFNMFAYCGNNPVMFFDPTGTETLVQDLNKADAGSLIIPWLFFAWLFGKKTNAPKTNNVVHTDVASAAPPPNWNNDDDDDDDDDYYDDESNFGGRQRMGRSNGNTPRNNQVQNSQVDDIVQKTGLSDYGRRVLHNEITGKGLGYWEIMETAKQIAERGGKYVLWILEGN